MTVGEKLRREYDALLTEERLLRDLMAGLGREALVAEVNAYVSRLTYCLTRQSEIRVELAQLPPAPPAKVIPMGSWEDGGR